MAKYYHPFDLFRIDFALKNKNNSSIRGERGKYASALGASWRTLSETEKKVKIFIYIYIYIYLLMYQHIIMQMLK